MLDHYISSVIGGHVGIRWPYVGEEAVGDSRSPSFERTADGVVRDLTTAVLSELDAAITELRGWRSTGAVFGLLASTTSSS